MPIGFIFCFHLSALTVLIGEQRNKNPAVHWVCFCCCLLWFSSTRKLWRIEADLKYLAHFLFTTWLQTSLGLGKTQMLVWRSGKEDVRGQPPLLSPSCYPGQHIWVLSWVCLLHVKVAHRGLWSSILGRRATTDLIVRSIGGQRLPVLQTSSSASADAFLSW